MAGGQAITSGQGSVTQSEDVPLVGSAVTGETGFLSGTAPVEEALAGEASASAAGTAVSGAVIRLRSRKVGGGSATAVLLGGTGVISQGTPVSGPNISPVGVLLSASQGAFAKDRLRALTGSAATAVTGTVSLAGGAIDGLSITSETATPEQIGLYLIPTRTVGAGSVTVRYRRVGTTTWLTGHPLLRIVTTGNETDGPTTLVPGYAGTIFDLLPGIQYEIELTHVEAGQADKKTTILRTTRALPATTGTANKTIAAGSSATTIQTAFNNLVAGDVIEFAAAGFTVSGLTLGVSNVTIRGASRTSTILTDTTDAILTISASNVVIENLTLQGSGVDGGSTPTPVSRGIDITGTRTNVTVRNVNISGVDGGIGGDSALTGALIYNCQLAGNNPWSAAAGNSTWNDDGINVPGFGNAVWNNTLSGFGDSLACNKSPNIGVLRAEGIYFYRNRINNNGDDLIEFDYGTRNIACYDNLITNTATAMSMSYPYGGPCYYFRNIVVNTIRGPYKCNAQGVGLTGMLIYNNTVVRTDGVDAGAGLWGMFQPSGNGTWNNYSFRNNLLVYRGTAGGGGGVLQMGADGNSPCDFTHNAWFPDGKFTWAPQGSFSTLALARSGLSSKPTLFGSAQRHVSDVITVTNPFVNAITLGASHTTEYTAIPDATLSASGPKGVGIAIPGITDGFTGGAPDIGAIITGRPAITYGADTPQPAPGVFPVSVDSGGRFLKQADNTPFPILGRTLWALISVNQVAQRSVIDDTAAKGYNTIEVAIPHHWNTLSGVPSNQPPYANNGALLPFTTALGGGAYAGGMGGGSSSPDMSTLNEPYWAFVDSMLDYAASKGILVCMFPCYNGAGGGSDGWMQEMLSNGTTKMQQYGVAIGQRFANKTNIIWMLAGDHGSPYNSTSEENVMNAFITGLTSVTKVCNLYSAELKQQSTSRAASTTLLRNTINVNGSYSWIGQCATWARTAYSENTPPMPAYQQEQPFDEEGPDGNGFNGNATQPVRRFWYHGWLNSIQGYIQGNGYVWPFRSTGTSPPTSDNYANHLNTTATQDAARLNAFIKSISWQQLVPDGLGTLRTSGAIVTSGGGSIDATNYVCAAATPLGDLLVAYLGPSSGNPTIDMTKLQGTVTARWFDPTNASYQNVTGQPFANTGTRTFTKPGNNSAGQGDWVLRLDSAAAVPAWVASLNLLQVTEIPNTTPTSLSGVDSGQHAWSGAVWDDTRNNFIIAGGGHGDSDNNNIFALRLGQDVPTFTTLIGSSSSTQQNVSYYSPDGRPSSRHTYSHMQLVPSTDRFMYFGLISPWGDGNFQSNAVCGFNLATNTWDATGGVIANTYTSRPDSAGPTMFGEAICATNDAVYICSKNNNTLYKWTPGIPGSFATFGSAGPSTSPWYDYLVWDSTRNRLVYFSWGTSNSFQWALPSGTRTAANFTGPSASQAQGGFWVHVPDWPGGDKFIGIPERSNSIFQCDAATLSVSPLSLTGVSFGIDTAPSNGSGMIFGRIRCISKWGVIVVLPSMTQNLRVFRYR